VKTEPPGRSEPSDDGAAGCLECVWGYRGRRGGGGAKGAKICDDTAIMGKGSYHTPYGETCKEARRHALLSCRRAFRRSRF
jgi:hypothetical protein